jgi:hypothetical protein
MPRHKLLAWELVSRYTVSKLRSSTRDLETRKQLDGRMQIKAATRCVAALDLHSVIK